MRLPTPVLVTLVVAGGLMFGIGYWIGALRHGTPAGGPERRDSERGGANSASIRPALPDHLGEGGSAGGGGETGFLGSGPPLDLAAALENPHVHLRERDLEILGERDFASGADWRAAAASIGDLVDRARYLRGVVTAWAGEAPDEAVAYLSTLSLSFRAQLIPHAVSLWAGQSPESAETWILSLPGGEVRDRAVDQLFRSWAALDPAEAAKRSLELGEPSSRYRALAAAVKEWSANDLGSAGTWVAQLGDPTLKDLATMAVADELSVRAPGEAMRWALEHLRRDAQANPDIVSLVSSKAGFEQPRETFEWLQTVPPSPESASSLAGVAAYLAEDDPDFPWNGFAELSDDMKQLAAGPVASVLGSQNPAVGQRWLGGLPEGEMKRWATMAFASGWVGRDPAAAGAWVASLPPGPQKDAATQGLESANPESGGVRVP